jgi:hypothetical protein
VHAENEAFKKMLNVGVPVNDAEAETGTGWEEGGGERGEGGEGGRNNKEEAAVIRAKDAIINLEVYI